MAYEILVNITISAAAAASAIAMPPANKPQYTPKKALKKALKKVCKFFKKSNKHQKFLNETIHACDADDYSSEEELENLENERKEAANTQQN